MEFGASNAAAHRSPELDRGQVQLGAAGGRLSHPHQQPSQLRVRGQRVRQQRQADGSVLQRVRGVIRGIDHLPDPPRVRTPRHYAPELGHALVLPRPQSRIRTNREVPMAVDTTAEVLAALSEHGTVQRIRRIEDAPDFGYHVYAVFNGPEVLQIGRGSGARMQSCMRGALARRHSKAFICAFGERVLGRHNEYAYIEVYADSAPARKERSKRIEHLVHERFGIRTNVDAACLIAGLTDAGPVSIRSVNHWLWERVVVSDAYRGLSAERMAMAEELMDLVTWGTVCERKTASVRLTHQGDLLEGHMLEKIGKAYLIHIFQELTRDYLLYGCHKLSDEVFRAREEAHKYVPRGTPFEIVIDCGRPAEGMVQHSGRRRRTIPTAPTAAIGVSGARVLSRKSKLEFRKAELEGLAPEAWIEFTVFNEGTRADPRRIDLLFRCQVRDVYGFFPTETDADWRCNRRHSWSRFPNWALPWVVRGGVGA